MINKKLALWLAAFYWSVCAFAGGASAPKPGEIDYTSYGIGNMSCWTAIHYRPSNYDVKASEDKYKLSMKIQDYVDGYLTAFNLYADERYHDIEQIVVRNIRMGKEKDDWIVFMDKYCKNDKKSSISDALNAYTFLLKYNLRKSFGED